MYMVCRYHDGMMALNLDQPLITMKRLFYPKWWLQASGYFDRLHGHFGPDAILFAPSPLGSSVGYYAGLLFTALVSGAASVAVVLYVLQRQQQGKLHGASVFAARHEYTPIVGNAEL